MYVRMSKLVYRQKKKVLDMLQVLCRITSNSLKCYNENVKNISENGN